MGSPSYKKTGECIISLKITRWSSSSSLLLERSSSKLAMHVPTKVSIAPLKEFIWWRFMRQNYLFSMSSIVQCWSMLKMQRAFLFNRGRQRHWTPWSIVILNSSQELLPQLRSLFIHHDSHSMSILVLSFSKCFSESSSVLDWRNVNFQSLHFLTLLHAYKRLETVGFFLSV